MTRTEMTTRLFTQSQRLPEDVLLEVLDFMEFIAARRGVMTETAMKDEWKRDFLSISQWDVTEQDVAISSWKIEAF